MIYPEWNVNGICQEPGVERTTQVTSLAQVLKDNGYHTIHCGKAHFGANDTPGADPLKMGFDVNIAGHAAGSPASYYGMQNFGNKPGGKKPAGCRTRTGKNIMAKTYSSPKPLP